MQTEPSRTPRTLFLYLVVAVLFIAAIFYVMANSGAPEKTKQNASVSYEFFRNATAKLTYAGHVFLLDPMLGPKGAYPPFAGLAPNPIIDLPVPAETLVAGIDAVLVGHMHIDHFDPMAAGLLDKAIPVITPNNQAPTNPADPENSVMSFKDQLVGYGFTNVTTIEDEDRTETVYENVTIKQVFGLHGEGVWQVLAGGMNGFIISAEGAPTIYWTGDTVLDQGGEVRAVLKQYKPDLVIAHTGGAVIEQVSTDPLMMDEAQFFDFAKEAKAANPDVRLIAVHMNALDHCRTTRENLLAMAATYSDDIKNSVFAPVEGELIEFKDW